MEHTEKVIEEMLENLLQSDDDVESFDEASTVVQVGNLDELNEAEKSNSAQDDVEEIYNDIGSDFEQLESTTKPSSAHNLTIAEELRKMREEYPMSADSEETLTTPSTIALKTASIASGGGGDISPKTSSSKISYDAEQIAYRNEVSRVLFAGKLENCPAENTPEYFAAAQEYAIYGNDFMDFLPDFEQVYSQVKQSEDKNKQATSSKPMQAASTIVDLKNAASFEDARLGIGKTPKSRFDFANRASSSNLSIKNDGNANEQMENPNFNGVSGSKNNNNNINNNNNNESFHNYPPRAPVVAQQQKPLSAVATAGAATAATYYQLCSNLQRPNASNSTTAAPTFNTSNTAAAAVNTNMLLSNNVAHAPSVPTYQPPVFPHQQLSAATNLNQAAAYNVASNVRFASNAPLLPLATTTPATSGVNVGAVNVYERMVYAQLLQQQLIKTRQQQLQQQQQQQAIAAATIFQQQLQRQQQLKMAAAMQHVAHVANANVATSGVDLTANVNMQRSSPNPQVVNFSATLTCSQSRSNSTNKPAGTNFNHGNFNNSREGNNGPN